MKRHAKRLAILVVVLALFATVALARKPLLVQLGQWLDVGGRPRVSEFVVALPGDEQSRPFVAAALLKAGFAKQVLILPSQPSPDEDDGLVPSTAEITRRVYEVRGVAPQRLVSLTGTSTSTFHDATIVRDYLRHESAAARLIVVTNDYHSRRARWIFHRVFGAEMKRVTFVSAPLDGVSEQNWWTRGEGLYSYCSEYIKLAAYLLAYGGVVVWSIIGLLFTAAAIFVIRGRRRHRVRREQATPSASSRPELGSAR